jgi:hypothetical protein
MKTHGTYEEPALQLAGLSLWVHGLEFPSSDDFWDGNWLRCTIECKADGAFVKVTGPNLRSDELELWLEGLRELSRVVTGSLVLEPIEPNLRVRLDSDEAGHLTMVVDLTPDPSSQSHTFTFLIDQSYLPAAIAAISRLCARYPVRARQ